jgi:heme-degrading monooxygenase HmoA
MHGHVTGRNADGTAWVMYQWHAMGTPGATAERDGFIQMGHLITRGGLDLPNLEFHEQMYPVRYICHEQRIDNAGAGATRGGAGVRYEADILVPATWSFRAEGLDPPSGYGVQGGMTGGVGYEWVVPAEAEADGPAFIAPKYGVKRLGPARMIAETPGGGAGAIDSVDGFEGFELLRPTDGKRTYYVYTRWATDEAFQEWRRSEAFGAGHAQHSEKGPVGTGSDLFEFEVVISTP